MKSWWERPCPGPKTTVRGSTRLGAAVFWVEHLKGNTCCCWILPDITRYFIRAVDRHRGSCGYIGGQQHEGFMSKNPNWMNLMAPLGIEPWFPVFNQLRHPAFQLHIVYKIICHIVSFSLSQRFMFHNISVKKQGLLYSNNRLLL